jgi:hypothetical protein
MGEPNINCAFIPLNPTYYMLKGNEVETPPKNFSSQPGLLYSETI